jgi:hypothetical protein
MMKTPLLACQMLKWFYDTSTGITTRAACYGSLLERLRSLELTTMEGARWTWGFMWFGPLNLCILVCMVLFKP